MKNQLYDQKSKWQFYRRWLLIFLVSLIAFTVEDSVFPSTGFRSNFEFGSNFVAVFVLATGFSRAYAKQFPRSIWSQAPIGDETNGIQKYDGKPVQHQLRFWVIMVILAVFTAWLFYVLAPAGML